MFYIIFFAVIALALYVILHDRHGDGDSARKASGRRVSTYRPEPTGPVPQAPVRRVQTPVSQQPKPVTQPQQFVSQQQKPASRPLASDSPTPKPLEPAPRPAPPPLRPVMPARPAVAARPAVSARPTAPTLTGEDDSERPLTWSYLYNLLYDEDLEENTMETEITGMRYYCSLDDVGPVNGFVRPEPANPHDPRAQVVIRADGKKLGYIPRYALDEYEEFNEDSHTCPFAGRISVDKLGYMHARILVVLPESRDFVKEALTEYLA